MRLERAVAGAVVLLVLLGVGGLLAFQFGAVPKPTVEVRDVGDWGTVTAERTEVITTLRVENPYPVRLKTDYMLTIRYHISMNGVRVAEGTRDYVDLPPGTSTAKQSTYVTNERLEAWWVNYVRANETIHLAARGEATFRTPVETFTYPLPSVEKHLFTHRQPLAEALSKAAQRSEGRYVQTRSVGAPSAQQDVSFGVVVEETWVKWGKATPNRTTLLVGFQLTNPSDVVPIVVAEESLEVHMLANDVALVEKPATGVSSDDVTHEDVIQPGETRTLVVPLEVDNDRIDKWFVTHVRNGERSRVAVHLQLVVRPPGSDEAVRVPGGDGVTYRCNLQTGMLVDNQTTGSTCGRRGGPTTGQ